MVDLSDDELLAELGVEVEQKKARTYTPREERIIAGFEDILKFHDEYGRAPQHGEERDIFERIYAVRLDRLRELEECRELLADMDELGLLDAEAWASHTAPEDLDDDSLLSELGVESSDEEDITQLRHVQSREERRAAEEIANREKCADFDKFQHLFEQVKSDLDSGTRLTRKFVKDAGFLKSDIVKGQFFILGGQVAYVADVGEIIKAPNGEYDARLRVIYSNGTESNLLRRSLQRALYKDEAGRRITEPEAGPLFKSEANDDDTESGTIYVLRSKSDHSMISENRELIHKIGVTGGKVESRISGAKKDATYLLSDVEIVATYTLYNINRNKLEKLLHRFFSGAQLDFTIEDRFGNRVKPREWFLVPLTVIDEVVGKVRDKTISNYRYDPESASLKETS
ncbi:GIY-YIG nuclease family protein [Parasphingorhabdus sp.]|uniref:GIY-YIG nuclease family protein n=1 Tax=Parasphingorhabdus sp. TaxID=2709688 RepID=UPI003BB1547A|tara:strand:- start:542 stop:1741 length:1200 start_codon:yes stop_codon:yes gene_type:complete